MIVLIQNEKTNVTGLSDAFGAPLNYGDKVIVIESSGTKSKAYYIGTTPSGATDKVLKLGSVYLSRPYHGVIKYDWKTSDKKAEETSIEFLKTSNPFDKID